MNKTIEERFWSKVDFSGNCWIWKAGKTKDGYGRFGVSCDNKKLAHRFAWELINGPISEDILILHHCDNPPCCNPAHLFTGTYLDNRLDCVNKEREGDNAGEKNPSHKL